MKAPAVWFAMASLVAASPAVEGPFDGKARCFADDKSAIESTHPADIWEWTLESGYLWNVGDNTDIDYEIIPTQLTLRSPVVWTWWQDENGAEIVVRNRFSALFETITVGPEDHYIGAAAAPSIEYWFPNGKTSAFFSIGGGAGWTNSSGGSEGQGQDFTFNWFTQLGIRQEILKNVSLLAGVYFIHHSNLGLTDPNPGIDALGFTIGCGWTF
jgi:lipid A 3-O-deacylase